MRNSRTPARRQSQAPSRAQSRALSRELSRARRTLRTGTRALAATLAAVLLTPLPATTAQAQPQAQPTSPTCPAVAVVAARGSEQNEHLAPTRYSTDAPWVSNGYEEENLRAFFQLAEARHRAATGESLMKNVQVIGLDASVYPADLHVPRIAEVGEDMTPLETARRIAALLEHTPASTIVWNATSGFVSSIVRGTAGVSTVMDGYESTTGCHPNYIFLGYSQGAAILQARERDTAARTGRLYGALYIGNPLLAPGDPSLVGDPQFGIGLLGLTATNSLTTTALPTQRRLNYCLRDDFVCDAGPDSAAKALAGGGGTHALYFLHDAPTTNDAAVVAATDTFRRWVGEVVGQAEGQG